MAKVTETMTSYLREAAALVQGDKDEVLFVRNERRAIARLEGQILAIKGQIIDLEEAVGTAEENKMKAVVITGKNFPSNYTDAILNSENELTEAKDELEAANNKVKFFEGVLKDIKKTVTVEVTK